MITDDLVKQGILKILPEVSDSEKKGYEMFDDGGVELEVGEFLYSLIRVLKPERVLTTGIYTGISDLYIAKALQRNKIGHSTALEHDRYHFDRAKQMWNKAGIGQLIDAVLTSSLEFKPEGKYQFMFLDTEPNIRFQELVNFYSFLDEGGYVFIHDLPRNFTQGNFNSDHPEVESWPFGNLPEQIKEWINKGELVKFHLPSPRGLVGFYKLHSSDYKI